MTAEDIDLAGRGPRACDVQGEAHAHRDGSGPGRRRASVRPRGEKRHRRVAVRPFGDGRVRAARQRAGRRVEGRPQDAQGRRRDRRRRRVRGQHRRGRVRPHNDGRMPSRGCRCGGQVRERRLHGRRRRHRHGSRLRRPCQGGRQRACRRRRGQGRRGHRAPRRGRVMRRRGLPRELRGASDRHLRAPQGGRDGHGKRAGASQRGAGPGPYTRVQRLRHRGLHPRRRRRSGHAPDSEGRLRRACPGRQVGGVGVRLRDNHRGRRQRRLRLHQEGGGQRGRASDDAGQHEARKGADVRIRGRHPRVRAAWQPRGCLLRVRDDNPPGAAQDAGLHPSGAPMRDGAPDAGRPQARIPGASSCAPR